MEHVLELFDAIGVLARRRYQTAERHFARLGLNHSEARLLTLHAALEAEARSSDDPLAYSATHSWLNLRLEELRGDDSSMESAPELLAWLETNSAEFT